MAFQIPSVEALSAPRDAQVFATEDSLVSQLHAAFHNLGHHNHVDSEAPTPSTHHRERDRDKHMSLEISVAADVLHLKGTGVDVEPALLAGNVVLHLAEATSIREINLQFRGKARLSLNPSDPHVINSAPSVYVVCNHDWSFLEGEKKHSHTLKPGRHLFPFQLRIGGSLPSTTSTFANGGASVFYKLRATAVRPGFASNLTATCPITILRSFATEALEYQQTLEIENTWPDKLMYSLMLPHKAWAAGDDLSTLVKFAPLAKGVRVQSVTTFLNETVRTFSRAGYQESTRHVVQMKHNLVGNRAVPVFDHHTRPRLQHQPSSNSNPSRNQSPPHTPGSHHQNNPWASPDLGNLSDGSNYQHHSDGSAATAMNGLQSASGSPADGPDEGEEPSEVTAHLVVPLPKGLTPSHTLDPILVSYRVRWIIIITNLDGHTSELRCSLPVHILDNRLLNEAVNATKATRRLLFGGPETDETDEDMELPSYPAHVRDRVANIYMPEAATMRITNPWVINQIDPVTGHMTSGVRTPVSGFASPLYSHPLSSQFPYHPDATTNQPLEWVNSELLLSLSEQAPPAPSDHGVTHSPRRTPPETSDTSQPGSRRTSRRPSRANSRTNSRTGSPERAGGPSNGIPSVSRPDETHVHALNPGSRQNSGLFHIAMKPLTSLTHPWSHATSRSHAMAQGTTSPGSGVDTHRQHTVPVPTTQDPNSGAALLHRAFTEVPDYAVASRGFLGGGAPPLDMQRGLPSYDEARRTASSDTNLAAYFARVRESGSGASSNLSLEERTA